MQLTILATAVIMLIPITMGQSVDSSNTTTCPPAGLNGENRCYATKTYFSKTPPSSVNVDVTSDDVSVSSGFLQNALWTWLSNSRLVEAGFLDQSSNSEKIVCGEDGWISDASHVGFSDGHIFNIYSLGLANGAVWKTGIKHFYSNAEEYCTVSNPSGTYLVKFIIGSEASRPNNPNYEHEWDDLEIDYSNAASSHFSGTLIAEEGSGYDVESCGSGNEQYRHIKTGKGDMSSC